MPDLNATAVRAPKISRVSRRMIVSCCLAALCVAVLGTRVYDDFERVRVRVLPAAMEANQSSIVVEIPSAAWITRQPVAIVLRLRGGPEPADITVALDGQELVRKTVPANREVRIDASTGPVTASAHSLTLTASRPGWTLTLVEFANIHGFSDGLASLIVVPRIRTVSAPTVPAWLMVAALVLIALQPRFDWPAHHWRYLHRVAVGLVLALFAVTLLAPSVTPYRILLGQDTFVLSLVVLYAEPLVRIRRRLARLRRETRLPEPVHTRIPWWVTAFDIACLFLLAILVRSWLGGGYQMSVGPGVGVSMNSVTRLALWLIALLVVRHLAWNVVPWPIRVAAWVRATYRWPPLRAAWPPFATSRLMVLVVGYVAVATIGFEGQGPPWRALDNDWLDLYARWDSGWYFTIATQGYPTHLNPERTSAIAFFPGLPLLMRGAGALLDIQLWIAGILLVVVGFLLGLTYLYRLALMDLTPDQARASLMFLAFYPFAFCYSAVLTESLFLLAVVAAFYHFRKGHLWATAAFGLLVGVLRPNGFLLAVPLGLMALLPLARRRGWLPEWTTQEGDVSWPTLAGQLAVAIVPVAGVVAYSAYLQATIGNPFGWAEAQQAWGRAAAHGLTVLEAREALIETQGLFAYIRSYPIEIIEAAAAFFALGAVWPIARRFGLAYGLFVAMAVLPPLISMGSVSLGRYTAPLFPIFLWLGAAVPVERRPYWLALFAAGQALLSALFFTWRPPY